MFKISVIVPIYNTSKYLKKCLDSILNQTFNDFEIICINDGSTDNSSNILNEYAQKDSRISIITQNNEGQAKARNLGISQAKGEYIAFVDSDDFIEKDMLEKLYKKIKKHDLDLVMCKISLFDDETKNINNNAWYYKLGVFNNFNKEIFNHKDTFEFTCEIAVTPFNKLYKKDLLLKNNIYFPEGLIFEDEKFFFDVYLKANKVSLVNEFLYNYRTKRIGSTVDISKENNYEDMISIYELIRKSFQQTGNYEDYKILLANRMMHLTLIRYSQTSSKYQENYFNRMKKDFEHVLQDKDILKNLNSNVKFRVLKILNSKNFNEFKLIDEDKLFSIIIACYNCEKYLVEAIDSVLNQSLSFLSNVQLILVNDGSTDNTEKICKKYQKIYPNNIIYLYQENAGPGAARNLGLKYVKGKYVNFLDSDDKFSGDTLKAVFDFFEKHFNIVDFVSIPVKYFDAKKGNHLLNYKFKSSQIIDLTEKYDYPQLFTNSSFFKRELFNKYKFSTNLINSEDSLLINQILLEKMAYGVINNCTYWYRKRVSESSKIDSSYLHKEFYLNRLVNYFKKLITYSLETKNHVPKFIQYLIVYDLQWMIKISSINEILNSSELKKVYNIMQDILSYIDDNIILSLRNDYSNVKNHILAIKHGDIVVNNDCSVNITNFNYCPNDCIAVYSNNVLVDRLDIHKIWIDIIEIKNNILYISGLLMSFFNKNNIIIEAIKTINNNYEVFSPKIVKYTNLFKDFLGLSLEKPINFDFKIPLNKNEKSIIELQVKYVEEDYMSQALNLKIDFQDYARLSLKSHYFIKNDYFINFLNNKFHISKYNWFKMIKTELPILKRVLNSKEPYYTSILFFRLIYLILFPFYRHKKIWLFMDRQDLADDNAEALFKYAITKKEDGIKKYFTISNESTDFNRLIDKYENVLNFYSIKQRLVYLFAEKIISSHPDEIILNPFMGKNIRWYSGLINSDKIFLQHGVTKDNISSWLRKYDKNVSLIVTTSDLEQNSFYDEGYNYDKNIVQVLGFPRFDSLNNKSDTCKQILIMPSWRNNLRKATNNQILDSNYFKSINSLINNKELINLAKTYNYKIIFKPHPLVYKFIHLFDKNNYVEFDEGTKYPELFMKSDLMITDYSSVSFDFAYMNKPVVYYQYANDYNFDEGYFNYKSMGFGEVVHNDFDLNKIVESYLKNNCMMKEKYLKRKKNFYKFNDNNNCNRVYNAILDLDK